MDVAILGSLDQHLEEKGGIASHKSLSIAFGWSLEESQSNLEKYIKKHSEIKPIFCVSGFQQTSANQWNIVVRLTTSSDSAFDKDLMEPKRQIYSIHKTQTINVDSLACFDKSLEQDPVSHPSLISFPWKYKPLKSSVSTEKLEVADPKPSQVKQLRHNKSVPFKSASSSTIAAPRKSAKRQPKCHVQSSLKFESLKSEQDNPSKVFDSAPDPFADSDDGEHQEDARVIQNKRRRIVISSDDEDAMESEVSSKVNKTSDKGVSKVAKMDTENPLKYISDEPTKTRKANHKLLRKEAHSGKTTSRKAEEERATKKKDESSDEEMIKLASSQGVKPLRSSPPSRARNPCKRKVTKTFVDDDGFLITENVWEEVDETDIEMEKTEPAKPLPPSVKLSSSSSPVKNVTNSRLKGAKQATLMSFFKK